MVTTDRRSHFGRAFANWIPNLGCAHIRTTIHLPQVYGSLVKLRRRLKSAPPVEANSLWSEILRLALLGSHNSFKDGMVATSDKLMFGRVLRIPGELVAPLRPTHFSCGDNAKRLARHMWTIYANSPWVKRSWFTLQPQWILQLTFQSALMEFDHLCNRRMPIRFAWWNSTRGLLFLPLPAETTRCLLVESNLQLRNVEWLTDFCHLMKLTFR